MSQDTWVLAVHIWKDRWGEGAELAHGQRGENGMRMLKEACEQEGITITFTGTEAHQENGEQERWFRSAFDCVWAHQIVTNVPINLWADGMANFVYVYNRM